MQGVCLLYLSTHAFYSIACLFDVVFVNLYNNKYYLLLSFPWNILDLGIKSTSIKEWNNNQLPPQTSILHVCADRKPNKFAENAFCRR